MISLLQHPISAVDAAGGPVMVIGVSEHSVLVVGDEGTLSLQALDGIRIDWRYDWKTGAWYDVGTNEEDDGDEETPDDRSPEVPGDLPDPD